MPDYSPASDKTRGQVPFSTWAAEVTRLLDVTEVEDGEPTEEGAALQHQVYALANAYQVDELSPRQFVEGVEAAVAFAEAAADSPEEAAEAAGVDVEDPDEDDDDEDPEVAGDDSRFAQVFGDDGPEDTDRSEDPQPEAPFTPSDDHPAVQGQNFSEDATAE